MEEKIELLAILSQFKNRCSYCYQEMQAIIFDGRVVPPYRPHKSTDYYVWKQHNFKTDTFLGVFSPVIPIKDLPLSGITALSRARLKLQGTSVYTDLQFKSSQQESYMLKSKFDRKPLWIVELSCFHCGQFKMTYIFFGDDSKVKVSKWCQV